MHPDELVARYRVADLASPRIRVNFIASVDGAATHDGLSGGLNSAADKAVFDVLRMLADVVIVGAGTVRAEGYGDIDLGADAAAWRTSHGHSAQPPIAIVSSRLDISPGHPLFSNATVRPFIITCSAAPAERRLALEAVATVLVCGDDAVDMRLMREALASAGCPQMLCEGGPSLLGSLIEQDCVDEICLTISPVLEGGAAGRIASGGRQATRRMALLHAFSEGDMLFLRYERSAGILPA